MDPFTECGDLYVDAVKLDKVMQKRYDECEATYLRGERYCPVFKTSIKDEAITFEKAEIGKLRLFMGAPFEWSLVVRKYLLTFIKLVQDNKYLFEAAPGTNAHSLEWQQMRQYLVNFGDDRMVAGDFKCFDKKMGIEFIMAAFDIIISVCEFAHYSKNDIMVIRGIAIDICFAFCDFHGDLMQFLGSNPSGHPLTVIINSLVNSLYMRYAYVYNNPMGECDSFKRNVALMTYGDDNCMGISKKFDWFNHSTIAAAMATIGVEYTMADKVSESVPFIHIDNISFLKRAWRWDDDVKAYLAPLDMMSIEKMLLICTGSKSICPEDQMIATVESAMREAFFHGKKFFSEFRDMLQVAVCEEGLYPFVKESTFPTWDKLYTDFWENSKGITLRC
jgi:hypothetical protein